MSPLPLFPAPKELELIALAPDARGITIHMRAKRRSVPCPDCGELSERVHSRYTRTLADLPWHGTTVLLRVQTRRFFCPAPTCERRIFAERLSETAARYARRTFRHAESLRSIALALGGEAGARLTRHLAVSVSPDTLLRRIRAGIQPMTIASPRVLGVDEWAYRKGRNYGTILVDLERSRVVDLLPDRSADSFAAWLQEHPGVEIITRDRSSLYADGASRGAPNAAQVADRWHLIKNLTDAVERALVGRSALLKEASDSLSPAPLEEPVLPAPPPARRRERVKASRREARLQRYEEVVRLRGLGMSKNQIARTVGLSRRTVVNWLATGSFPERKERASTGSILDPYHAYIDRRFSEGCHNAAELVREIRSQGYAGSRAPVRDYVQRLRLGLPRSSTQQIKRPSSRKCAWWLVLDEAEMTTEQRSYIDALTGLCPEIRTMRFFAREFRRMLKERDLHALGPWVEAARHSLLRGFAAGIHADAAAVRAAITLPWSNGPVEGQVNRLKMLKRQMYGRANFDLLRERVLHAA